MVFQVLAVQTCDERPHCHGAVLIAFSAPTFRNQTFISYIVGDSILRWLQRYNADSSSIRRPSDDRSTAYQRPLRSHLSDVTHHNDVTQAAGLFTYLASVQQLRYDHSTTYVT